FLKNSEVYAYHSWDTIQVWLRNWGVFLIFGGIGFLHFRLRFYSYVAQLRTLELTMAIWLVSVMLMLAFKYGRLEVNDIILLAPPLAFYASKIFDFKWGGRFRAILIPLSLVMPVIIYLNYWGIKLPNSMSTFSPKTESIYYHGGLKSLLDQSTIWHAYDFGDKPTSIWLMDYHPEIYLSLDQKLNNKYLDYRIAWYKMSVLPHEDQGVMFSQVESDKDIFKEFSAQPPDYILDPHNQFPYLQTRYPALFGNFERDPAIAQAVYRRR
ncbi:MAG: hypothetical protein AAFP02_13945, partial [Bacteroidota bacterium]